MAIEQLREIITAAGLPAEEIDKVMALEEKDAQDFKPDEYVTRISTGIEEKIKNDNAFWEGLNEENVNPVFKKKIEAQQYGRAANIMRGKALKALNLKEDDLSELSDDEQKNVETFISKAIQKHLSTHEGASSKLQSELIAERNKLEALEGSLPKRDEEISAKLQTKFDNDKLDFIVLSELASLENLPVPAKYLTATIVSKLREKYAFQLNGFEATPMQKENPTLKVLDGNKIVSLKQLIEKMLVEDGVKLEKKEEEIKHTAGKFKIEGDGTGGLAISSHIQKTIDDINK